MFPGSRFDPLPSRIPLLIANTLDLVKPGNGIPHMSRIMKHLSPGQFVEFSELFEPERGVPVLVVSFLALLELTRESLIEMSQKSPFEPIYVKLKSERAALTIA